MKPDLTLLLEQSSARHEHLCPRQVLGVRLGLAGLGALGLESPINKDTGLVIVEMDGCFADGVEVATGAAIGHRTMKMQDLGKIAATFADVQSGRCLRVAAAPGIRELSRAYTPGEERHYFAQLQGYQVMPDDVLFKFQEVRLEPSLTYLVGRPNARVNCTYCGEEIINDRQVLLEGLPVCLTCAGRGYYTRIPIESYELVGTDLGG